MKYSMDIVRSLCVWTVLIVGLAQGAPSPDADTQMDGAYDGQFLVKLGRQFDNPMLRLIGRVFMNRGVDKIEKRLTEKLCRLHPCTEWGAWTDCPVKSGFSMVTRSRLCNKTTDICQFDAQTEYTTTESRVCGGCPEQYNFTNGFCLKVYPTRYYKTDAISTCEGDGAFVVNINTEAKSDAVHALLKSFGYTSDTIWLDGQRSQAGGTWEFTYGSAPNFDNWHSTEPTNGSTELCKVEEDTVRKWYDRSCNSNSYLAVCEIP